MQCKCLMRKGVNIRLAILNNKIELKLLKFIIVQINLAYIHIWLNKGLFESENILNERIRSHSLYDFTIINKTWYFKNSYLIIIVQMFRMLFHLPRSSILNKDLLLHVNPYKTINNVHTKILDDMTVHRSTPAKISFLAKFYKS